MLPTPVVYTAAYVDVLKLRCLYQENASFFFWLSAERLAPATPVKVRTQQMNTWKPDFSRRPKKARRQDIIYSTWNWAEICQTHSLQPHDFKLFAPDDAVLSFRRGLHVSE